MIAACCPVVVSLVRSAYGGTASVSKTIGSSSTDHSATPLILQATQVPATKLMTSTVRLLWQRQRLEGLRQMQQINFSSCGDHARKMGLRTWLFITRLDRKDRILLLRPSSASKRKTTELSTSLPSVQRLHQRSKKRSHINN